MAFSNMMIAGHLCIVSLGEPIDKMGKTMGIDIQSPLRPLRCPCVGDVRAKYLYIHWIA